MGDNRHWMGSDIQPSQVSEEEGEGEEQKKEHKQAPSLSHTRATAAGREPDFSWSFCLCFSSPLSENQEVKAPNLDVYLK